MGGDHASGEVLRGAARHGACVKCPMKDRTIAEVAESYDLVAHRSGHLGRKVQEGARHRPGPPEGLRVGLRITKLKAEVRELRGVMRVLKRAAAWLRRSPDGGLSRSARRARRRI